MRPRRRSNGDLNGAASLSVAVMRFLGVCCAARPDWIQSTLVTTDVTGTWRGTARTPGPTVTGNTVVFILQQRGPKVTGKLETSRYSGALEGSVEGDVFMFAATFASIKGEATVAGDEMTGQLRGDFFGIGSQLFLRRGESAVPNTEPGSLK